MFSAPWVSRSCLALLVCLLAASGNWRFAAAQFDELPDFGDFGGFGAGSSSAEVSAESQFTPATAEQPARLFVTLKISPGYHVYAVDQGGLPGGGGGPMPTKISVAGGTAKVLGTWRSIEPPHTHIDQQIWTGLELREHERQVTWYAPIELSRGTDLSALTITGQVEGQACNPQTCVPFEHSFAAQQGAGFDLPQNTQTDGAANRTSEMSLLTVVGYALLGGLILNLMPCVLPVIGLKVLSFAKQGGQSRAQIFFLNLSYVAGMLLVFMLLATLAVIVQMGFGDLLGIAGDSLAWGELNTITWFKVAMASLVFAMALSFLGTWEIPIPGFAGSSKASQLSSREGPLGAFMMGVFTTILATPCSGPFLGPVFGYLIIQPVQMTYLVFASIGLGMALPYLLIGLFPSLVSWLPKPGAWMDTFKQLLGFVLLATVVWLCSAIPKEQYIATLSLLFAIWFACWWVGRTPITASGYTKLKAWLGGIGTAALVGFLAFSSGPTLPWETYSRAALDEARAQGKTVMIDFTAQWCLTCKTNLKTAINRAEVKQIVEENGVLPLLADWTDRNPAIKQALREHNSQSIPLLVIYPADASREPIVLPDLLTKQNVLEALSDAGPSAGFGENQEVATVPPVSGMSSRFQLESSVQ